LGPMFFQAALGGKGFVCAQTSRAAFLFRGRFKRHFRPATHAARLHRRPRLARSAGSSPSTPRLLAAAASSKAWRCDAPPGHAAEDGVRERVRGFLVPEPRDGPDGKAGGGTPWLCAIAVRSHGVARQSVAWTGGAKDVGLRTQDLNQRPLGCELNPAPSRTGSVPDVDLWNSTSLIYNPLKRSKSISKTPPIVPCSPPAGVIRRSSPCTSS
jgi:hypothetical protein